MYGRKVAGASWELCEATHVDATRHDGAGSARSWHCTEMTSGLWRSDAEATLRDTREPSPPSGLSMDTRCRTHKSIQAYYLQINSDDSHPNQPCQERQLDIPVTGTQHPDVFTLLVAHVLPSGADAVFEGSPEVTPLYSQQTWLAPSSTHEFLIVVVSTSISIPCTTPRACPATHLQDSH